MKPQGSDSDGHEDRQEASRSKQSGGEFVESETNRVTTEDTKAWLQRMDELLSGRNFLKEFSAAPRNVQVRNVNFH